MKCPYCGSDDIKVIDKRESDEDSNRRRRECLKCGKRFTTYERIEMVEITVVKRDGRRESFNRDKILKGILKACEKRPISNETIQATVDEVEAEILGGENIEINSTVIGDLIMKHLKSIDEVAYIRFASVYRQFKDLDEFENELKNLKVVEHKEKKQIGSAENNPLVSTAMKDSIHIWDRQKIADALVKEINLSGSDASEIALSVEKKVQRSGVKTISVSLIRELVNNELFERNYTKKLEHQEILGMSPYNINQLLYNSKLAVNNIETSIAKSVLKQYSLNEVYSKDIVEAHLKASIHIHELGSIKPFSSMNSIEHIKKFGLKNPRSNGAKHSRVLTGQLSTFLSCIHNNYTDVIGFSYVNIFYSPLLAGSGKEYLNQEAQSLLFSCAKDSMPLVELHIYTNIPIILHDKPAIGPGGFYILKKPNNETENLDVIDAKYISSDGSIKQPDENIGHIMTYADFRREAMDFCKSMVESWIKGDGDGKAFSNIVLCLHMNAESFADSMQSDIIKIACKRPDGIKFVFERSENSDSAGHDDSNAEVLQNIAINLAQCSFKSKDIDGTLQEINKSLDIAVKAFIQYKSFVAKLAYNPTSDKPKFIIGIVGLEQCIQHLTSKNFEDTESVKVALKLMASIYTKCKEFEKLNNIRIILSTTPDAAERMGHIDASEYPGSQHQKYSDGVNSSNIDSERGTEEYIELAGRFSPIFSSPIIIDIIDLKADKACDVIKHALSNTDANEIIFRK